MGLINWNILDKKAKKAVAIWSAVGVLGSGGLGTGGWWIVGQVKESFEEYVQELAKMAVREAMDAEKDKKSSSLSYKLAKKFDIDRDEVAPFLHKELSILQQHTDSIRKFNQTLKPWAIKHSKTTCVGPHVLPNGRRVYIDYDGEQYRIRRHTDGRLIWIDADNNPHYVY